jgi:hypothetical protein
MFITPFFAEILKDCGMVFVNCVGGEWPSEDEYFENSHCLQPDGFAVSDGMYQPIDSDKRDGKRNLDFCFGIPIDDLKDCIFIFKRTVTNLTPETFEQVVRYLQHLSKSSQAILYNKTSFWLINSYDHVVFKVICAEWTQPGSKYLFTKFLNEFTSPWVKLLQAACLKFNVKVSGPNSYLGSGDHGRISRVIKDGKEVALKIVLQESIRGLFNEEHSLRNDKLAGLAVTVISSCETLTVTLELRY